MKALILNSGLGSRMGVLTSEHPKCMTEISAHETILSRQLKVIADAGIEEVVITTGYYDGVLINYCNSLELPLHFTFVKNPIYGLLGLTEVRVVNSLLGRENKVLNISTIQIRPNRTQPRRNFDEEELRSLSRSIVENGILQPLVVRRINSTEFELIAGERRLRAAIMAGLSKVPCVVHKCGDKDSALLALIENLQRTDLNMFEEARGIARLIRKYGLTQEQAAVKLGKRQSTVAINCGCCDSALKNRSGFYPRIFRNDTQEQCFESKMRVCAERYSAA